ncbi:MAG: hypothetical protein ACKO3V_00290, partial [Pirellula sp.]
MKFGGRHPDSRLKGIELKAERREPSGEKRYEVPDNPSLTGALAHFRFYTNSTPLGIKLVVGSLNKMQSHDPQNYSKKFIIEIPFPAFLPLLLSF